MVRSIEKPTVGASERGLDNDVATGITPTEAAIVMRSGRGEAGRTTGVVAATTIQRGPNVGVARVALGMPLAARATDQGVEVVVPALPLGASPRYVAVPPKPLELAQSVLTDPNAHTAAELAESIYFWSQHVAVDPQAVVVGAPEASPPLEQGTLVCPSIAAAGDVPALGWTNFSMTRQIGPGPFSRFEGPPEELLTLLRAAWPKRQPGSGRSDLEEVVRVPLPAARFSCATRALDATTSVRAVVDRRRPHEDSYVKVIADGRPDTPVFAEVVLYRAHLLHEDGDTKFAPDWGITAIIASSVANEPMNPLTMARNYLKKPGGSFAPYSAMQLAEAIVYWSNRAFVG